MQFAKCVQRQIVAVAVSLALALTAISPSLAQSNAGDDLLNRANALGLAGKFKEAIPLAEQALALDEKTFGFDDPRTALAAYSLGMLYFFQGRFGEAETLLKRLLASTEKRLGPDHPDVASVLQTLARVHSEQGRTAEAKPLYERSLAINEKAIGSAQPTTVQVLNLVQAIDGLGQLYHSLGRFDDAEALYKRALTTGEKFLGPDHQINARPLNNLAKLYADEGRDAEAEAADKRALAIIEKAFGPDNRNAGAPLNNLASLYMKQGRYAEAEPIYKRALAILEKSGGADAPSVGITLNGLAELYRIQGRFAEAEPLYKRSLTIREKALGPNHPSVSVVLNNLALMDYSLGRFGDALGLVRRTIANKTAATGTALPILFAAQGKKLVTGAQALDDSLNVAQRAEQTAAGEALNALAVRFSAGTGRLAEMVRKDQDLAAESAGLDKTIAAMAATERSERDAAAVERIKERLAAIARERDDLGNSFQREFPDYAALSRPEPLKVKDLQPLLADDEALVVISLGAVSYTWTITRTTADWKELSISADEVSKSVAALRSRLDFHQAVPFDAQASFALYQKILAPVDNVLRGKARLSLVFDGALTSLPPQVLVTSNPAGKSFKDVDWLIKAHAVTVLPSVGSLQVLRGKSAAAAAPQPLIGFADPIFDADPGQLQQNPRLAADVAAARGRRGAVADIAELKGALPRLPETADEMKAVAASVHADPADIFLGPNATESRVKQEKLDQFRIVYFATHGLLSGDVADFAKLSAEPALVLSLPEHPSELDDGLLTASEVAQLKLNADWVVLSACNTASGDKPGAEPLSGLARAFLYAGSRSLIVSNWEVDSNTAVTLMTGTFAALAADPKLSHGEALRKSMLAMIGDHPGWAEPKYWAPFVVVGEPARLAR